MNKDTQKVMFSSKSDDWGTPQSFFDKIVKMWGELSIDVAASHENSKCRRCFTILDDGLSQDWNGSVYCNPPYTRGQIAKWLAKAVIEVRKGNCPRAVFLIPARTDTKWWHEIVMKEATEVLFVKGRLKFESHDEESGKMIQTNPAPFPSAIVMFDQFKQPTGRPAYIGVIDR